MELSLRKIASANGKREVTVRLTITRKNRPTFQTGIYVNPTYFKCVSENSKGKVMDIVPPKLSHLNHTEYKEASDAKRKLDDFKNRLLRIRDVVNASSQSKQLMLEYLKLTERLTVEEITNSSIQALLKDKAEQERAAKTKAEKKTIYELGELYLAKTNARETKKRAFRVLMRDVARFELYQKKVNNPEFIFDVELLDKCMLETFIDYLKNEYILASKSPKLFKELIATCPKVVSQQRISPKIEQRGDNTIVKLKKMLNAFFNWLNAENIMHGNPFADITIGTEKFGEPICITKDERDMIANYEGLSPSLEIQRDIFIFQCLVGCRVGDLTELTWDNIEKGVLHYVAHKTKDNSNARVIRVPLTKKANEILERYKSTERKSILPFISFQKYNDAIKRIFTECGINRPVECRNPKTGEYEYRPLNTLASSHLARRTFIDLTYKETGNRDIVSKMSGHTEDSRAFNRYHSTDESMLKEAISKIEVGKGTCEILDDKQPGEMAELHSIAGKLDEEKLKILVSLAKAL